MDAGEDGIRGFGDPPRFGSEIEALSDVHLAELRRTEEFGTSYNFSEAIEDLRTIRDVVAAFAYQDTRFVPKTLIAEVSRVLGEVLKMAERRRKFAIATNPRRPTDANSAHVTLVNDIASARDSIVKSVVPYLRGDLAAVHQIARAVTLARDDAEFDGAQVKQLLDSLRETAGEVATGNLAQHFENEAKAGGGAAGRFLTAAVIAGAVTVAVAAWLLVGLPLTLFATDTDSWLHLIRELLIRLFAVAALVYVLRFLLRNYAVNKHLQVVNQQRANVLRTYPVLVQAVETEWAKDRVTVVVTQSAVAPSPSGYLSERRDDAASDGHLAAAIDALLRRN